MRADGHGQLPLVVDIYIRNGGPFLIPAGDRGFAACWRLRASPQMAGGGGGGKLQDIGQHSKGLPLQL